MHGPTKRAGAVAALEDIATPSLVAKAVMDYTDHIMLVGEDAKRFALEMGFKTQNLLTEKTRQDWLRWRARLNPNDAHLDYDGRCRDQVLDGHDQHERRECGGRHQLGDDHQRDGVEGAGARGRQPIIGAGQYCDNTVGAAGSTGRGEANIKVCGGFLTVEFMRQGLSPEAACLKMLERVVAMTETRLLDSRGRPTFDLQVYAVNKAGGGGFRGV
jgi:N4-(beta-N-acetylglucosaminyl)-L-asparaginase